MRQWHAAVLRASFCHFCKRHVGAGRRKHFRNAKTGIIVGAAEFLQGGLTSPEGRNVSRSVPVPHRSSKPPTHTGGLHSHVVRNTVPAHRTGFWESTSSSMQAATRQPSSRSWTRMETATSVCRSSMRPRLLWISGEVGHSATFNAANSQQPRAGLHGHKPLQAKPRLFGGVGWQVVERL